MQGETALNFSSVALTGGPLVINEGMKLLNGADPSIIRIGLLATLALINLRRRVHEPPSSGKLESLWRSVEDASVLTWIYVLPYLWQQTLPVIDKLSNNDLPPETFTWLPAAFVFAVGAWRTARIISPGITQSKKRIEDALLLGPGHKDASGKRHVSTVVPGFKYPSTHTVNTDDMPKLLAAWDKAIKDNKPFDNYPKDFLGGHSPELFNMDKSDLKFFLKMADYWDGDNDRPLPKAARDNIDNKRAAEQQALNQATYTEEQLHLMGLNPGYQPYRGKGCLATIFPWLKNK
ncbi:MAG: hypothetical protein AAB874_07385 [Patescibacteria group bacterium]